MPTEAWPGLTTLAFATLLVASPARAAEPEAPASEPAPSSERRVSWYDTPLSSPTRASIHAHLEAQLIGPVVGARVEGLYRPFRADRGANLVLGLGLAGGPEFAYLPFSLGWRQHFLPHRMLTLELGAGFEQHSFFVPGHAPVSRPAFYGEGGFGVRVLEGAWVGAQMQVSWAPFERPGPGLGLRVGFRWNFGPRNRA